MFPGSFPRTVQFPQRSKRTIKQESGAMVEEKKENVNDFDFDDFDDDEEEVTHWGELDLPSAVMDGLSELEWSRPLPIQARVLPMLLTDSEKHLIAQAPTGMMDLERVLNSFRKGKDWCFWNCNDVTMRPARDIPSGIMRLPHKRACSSNYRIHGEIGQVLKVGCC